MEPTPSGLEQHPSATAKDDREVRARRRPNTKAGVEVERMSIPESANIKTSGLPSVERQQHVKTYAWHHLIVDAR